MSKKYFINNIDSYLGQALFKELYKPSPDDPEAEPENAIVASYTDPLRTDKPKGIKKILKRSKPKLFAKYVIDSDVIIYDVHFGDITEVETVFKGYKQRDPPEEPHTLIFVSSILVWDGTEKKIKVVKPPEPQQDEGADPNVIKETAREDNDGNPDKKPTEENEENDENDEAIPPIVENEQEHIENAQPEPIEFEPFKEEDYLKRTPKEKYRYIKDLEDQVLSFKWQNVKTYVVCPGIFYGQGELAFKEHFKSAWLQNPKQLPYLGNGENCIPTIHVKDLAKFILKLAEVGPENQYHFAVDNSQDRRQKTYIESISRYIGTDQTVSVNNIADTFIQSQWEDIMRLDIDLVPSLILVNPETPTDFEWHCEKGLSANMDKLLKEFCEHENLKPIKIMIRGEPFSRKTDFANKLASHYNMPVINIQQVLEEGLKLEDDLGRDLREERAKLSEYFASGKETILDETTKVLYRLVKWRLSRNDCRNRGFVLDDFPRNKNEMEYIFYKKLAKSLKRRKPKPLKKPEKKIKKQVSEVDATPPIDDAAEDDKKDNQDAALEDNQEAVDDIEQDMEPQDGGDADAGEEANGDEPDEEEQEGELPKVENYFPDSVIYFRRDPKTSIPDKLKPKLKKFEEYRKTTKIDEFFDERDIEIYPHISSSKNSDFDILESLRIFIERNGRPNNYLKSPEELAKELLQVYEKKHNDTVVKQNKDKIKIQESTKAKEVERHKIAQEEVEYIKKFEVEHEQDKGIPFRKYLMGNIIPILGDGLVEVSQIIPDDPVEYLAEYLYRRSFEVRQTKQQNIREIICIDMLQSIYKLF